MNSISLLSLWRECSLFLKLQTTNFKKQNDENMIQVNMIPVELWYSKEIKKVWLQYETHLLEYRHEIMELLSE